MIQQDKPYLSIIATSRNDDHGGGMLRRMQIFVNGFYEQCQKHNLNAELLLVEWNPPSDRPPLAEVLRWPKTQGRCAIRIITVPPEIHRRFKYSDNLPLFQMIAKNVGIRRARGKFVLATNVDILFSDELIRYFALQRLQDDRMYRLDRYDVPMEVPVDAPMEQILDYCRLHPIRVNRRNGTENLVTGYYHTIYSPLKYLPMKYVPRLLIGALKVSLNWLPKVTHLLDEDVRLRTERLRLHTNACGDFTVMHRDALFALRGYAEFEMFSFHLDSLLCYCAHHAGFKEKLLKDPMRIYHLEHAAGWSPEIERTQTLKKHLETEGIPQLTNEQFDAWTVQMRHERKHMIFNDDNWGLADVELPEISVQ
jgi:hypothetical protein